MITEKQAENRIETERTSGRDMALGFAVIGCIIAGAVGAFKALSMQSGVDVLLCLLGSTVAFGAVFYMYVGKR
jgi:hypothetical protein